MITKGEWKVTQKLPFANHIIIYAYVEGDTHYHYERIADCYDNEANANLMAASKDMYEALREMEDTIYWGNTLEAEARHKRTLQALAKAEGKKE